MTIFLTTIISCRQVLITINRIQSVIGLTNQQKIEIVNELRKVVPSCPVIIQNDERPTKTRN